MEGVDIYSLKPISVDKAPRPVQQQMLDFTSKAILSNKKFIIMDAPTGVGKSLYATMFMDWFKKNYDVTAHFDVLTNSKILQEQYTKDFEFMQSLWGRGSYTCEKYSCDCGTGSEWARLQNQKCSDCPYATAKYKFEIGDVALTNFHLFLTYHIYMPMAWKRSSRVLIIDEAHDFDSVFCDFVTTKVSRPLLKRNGFNDDELQRAMSCFEYDMNGSSIHPEDLDIKDFVEIVKDRFLPVVKSVINRLIRESEDNNMQALNHLQSLQNHLYKWDLLHAEYNNLPGNWILETERIKKDRKKGDSEEYIEWTAQPVWAYPYLEDKVWSKYDFVIFMSGTILDKKMFCDINGLDNDATDYMSVPSPFPAENRPIYYFYKTGKQTFKTKDIVWTKQKPLLEKILKRHKSDKGILHTGNYEIQSWIKRDIESDRILAHDSNNRSEFLQKHYNSVEPTVLVSPSMMTGVDLKDEFSRHQTIIKMPYPNLKSKKIQRRNETNKGWYSLKTVQDLMQMYGRSIRSVDDHAATYVIDSCFGDVLKWSGHLIPQWVKDAIKYID